MMTVLWVGDPRFNYWQEYKISLLSKKPILDLEPMQPPVQWVLGSLYRGYSSSVMKCAAVLHIVSRLRVSGAVPALLLSVLWCGQEQLNLMCVVCEILCCVATSSYSCTVFMYTAQRDESP